LVADVCIGNLSDVSEVSLSSCLCVTARLVILTYVHVGHLYRAGFLIGGKPSTCLLSVSIVRSPGWPRRAWISSYIMDVDMRLTMGVVACVALAA